MPQQTETVITGRIREEIDVDGLKCWTLFDSGARNPYIRRRAARGARMIALADPATTRLGGAVHEIREVCVVQGRLQDHPLHFRAGVLDEIGRDEERREIDILSGAIAMQLWGIKRDLQNEKRDCTHFTTDFLEY